MSCVTIRGCRIGEGRTKVILPIVERTEAAILARAAEFSTMRADCVEWRADWFDAVHDAAALDRCLHGLREVLGEKLLLITFRTRAEGGEAALTPDQHAAFCKTVCASGCADLLDLELFPCGEALPACIAAAHAAGVAVVCSSHDFAKTPPVAEMVERMVKMQTAGADIAKLAVMPQSAADVNALKQATALMNAEHSQTPVITMSMGALGASTRLDPGTAMTFACAGKASAPGQLSLDEVNAALDRLFPDEAKG